MIDTQVAISSIVINNIIHGDITDGDTTFNVVVTGATFVGFATGILTSGVVNSRAITSNISELVTPLKIKANSPSGTEVKKTIPVTIPVGVYSGYIYLGPDSIPSNEALSYTSALWYSLTENGNEIPEAYVMSIIEREDTSGGGGV